MIGQCDYFADGAMMRMVYGNSVMADYYGLYEAGVPTFMGVYDLKHGAAPGRDEAATIHGQWPSTIPAHLWYEPYLELDGGSKRFDDNCRGVEVRRA